MPDWLKICVLLVLPIVLGWLAGLVGDDGSLLGPHGLVTLLLR
jgi:hypothetical protein